MEEESIEPSTSLSVGLQRIINATDLTSFLETFPINESVSSDSSSNEEDGEFDPGPQRPPQVPIELDVRSLFQYQNNCDERAWIFDVLQQNVADNLEAESLTETDITNVAKAYYTAKKARHYDGDLPNEMYYGVGLFSYTDQYPLNRTLPVPALRPIDRETTFRSPPTALKQGPRATATQTSVLRTALIPTTPVPQHTFAQPHPVTPQRKRPRKFKDEDAKKKWEDTMTTKRRKLFANIVKKEIGKQHRAKTNRHKELLIQCKRVALQCQRVVRQRAVCIMISLSAYELQLFAI